MLVKLLLVRINTYVEARYIIYVSSKLKLQKKRMVHIKSTVKSIYLTLWTMIKLLKYCCLIQVLSILFPKLSRFRFKTRITILKGLWRNHKPKSRPFCRDQASIAKSAAVQILLNLRHLFQLIKLLSEISKKKKTKSQTQLQYSLVLVQQLSFKDRTMLMVQQQSKDMMTMKELYFSKLEMKLHPRQIL